MQGRIVTIDTPRILNKLRQQKTSLQELMTNIKRKFPQSSIAEPKVNTEADVPRVLWGDCLMTQVTAN